MQSHARRHLSRWRGLGWALILPALLTSMVLFGGEIAGALTGRSTLPIGETLRPLIYYTLGLSVFIQLAIILQIIFRAAGSMTREHERGDWALLALSHIDSRRLVWGKWWATMRAWSPLTWTLILLRIGVITWIGAENTRTPFLQTAQNVTSTLAPPDPLKILLVVPLVVAFTFGLNAFAAAVGVLASSLQRRSALALAFALLGVLALYGAISGIGLVTNAWAQNPRVVRSVPVRDQLKPLTTDATFAWLTNGTLHAAALVDYHALYEYSQVRYVLEYNNARKYNAWVGALVITLGLYAGFTLGGLRLAQLAVERRGILPPAPHPLIRKRRAVFRPAMSVA